MENKTAMQELIEIVDMDYKNGVEISMKAFYLMLVEAVKKEEQQIIEAYEAGVKSQTGINRAYLKCGLKYFSQKYKP